MPFKRLTPALIGLTALWLTGCAVSKTATSERVESRVAEERITEARDSVVIEFRDTLKEVTTVTVQLDAVGDTVKVSTVTDRTRASDRSQLRDKSEKIIVRVDTVYVERRDSVQVKSEELRVKSDRPSAFVSALSYLKWIFWIIVSVTVLLIVIKMFNIFKV